jgi:hypothetical protein
LRIRRGWSCGHVPGAGDRRDRPALPAERVRVRIVLPCEHRTGTPSSGWWRSETATLERSPAAGDGATLQVPKVGNFSEQVWGDSGERRQRRRSSPAKPARTSKSPQRRLQRVLADPYHPSDHLGRHLLRPVQSPDLHPSTASACSLPASRLSPQKSKGPSAPLRPSGTRLSAPAEPSTAGSLAQRSTGSESLHALHLLAVHDGPSHAGMSAELVRRDEHSKC